MTTIEKNELGNKLAGKFYGLCDGARIYRVCRGFFQVQNPTRPHLSRFNGTKREIERALKHAIVNIR